MSTNGTECPECARREAGNTLISMRNSSLSDEDIQASNILVSIRNSPSVHNDEDVQASNILISIRNSPSVHNDTNGHGYHSHSSTSGQSVHSVRTLLNAPRSPEDLVAAAILLSIRSAANVQHDESNPRYPRENAPNPAIEPMGNSLNIVFPTVVGKDGSWWEIVCCQCGANSVPTGVASFRFMDGYGEMLEHIHNKHPKIQETDEIIAVNCRVRSFSPDEVQSMQRGRNPNPRMRKFIGDL